MDINSLLSPQDSPAPTANGSTITTSKPSNTPSPPQYHRTSASSSSSASSAPSRSTPLRSHKRAPSLVQQATTSPRHFQDAQQPSAPPPPLSSKPHAHQERPPSLLPHPQHHASPTAARYAPIAPQQRPHTLPSLSRNAHSSNTAAELKHTHAAHNPPFPMVQRRSSSSMDTLAGESLPDIGFPHPCPWSPDTPFT